MDLVSNRPYWSVKDGLPGIFPPLGRDEKCDVAVMGAGISGSLIAETLTAAGHDVIVLDRRDVATGSTSASTALLQYEIDTHLTDLTDLHGKEMARAAYRACYEAIDLLEQKIARLGLGDCGFIRKESVYFASKKSHVRALQAEAEARRQAGIGVTFWGRADLLETLGIDRPCAIHSEQAAQVDPYRLAHGLLAVTRDRGARIHDRTAVTKVEVTRSGVCLTTDRGFFVRAKRLVVAAGYEAGLLFDTGKLVALRSSFAVATEPLAAADRWWRGCLLWESARPYFYLREEADGRALMGGEDVAFRNPAARDALISRKAVLLGKRFHELFPRATVEQAFAWAGTFGETRDGLAYIGAFRKHPLCYFALGFGGNGIVYSVIAAGIIRDDLAGKIHPHAFPFRFGR